jgi:hypothetical protein
MTAIHKAMIFCFVLIIITIVIAEIVWRKYFEPLRKSKKK